VKKGIHNVPEPRERPPFPTWLRELCYFGGLIVVLTMYFAAGSAKQERFVEQMAEQNARLSSIEGRLPNKEADELRFKQLEEKVDKNRSDSDFEIAKLNKWKDDVTRWLIKKGVID